MNIFKIKTFGRMAWSLMVGLAMFPACSGDDKDGGVVNITFPELQEIVCGAGETAQVSIDAPADWTLTTSQGWCKFQEGDFLDAVVKGHAGNRTLTLAVSADGQNYTSDDVAELTMTMGEESRVVFKVTRPKKVFNSLTVKGADGTVYYDGEVKAPIVIKGSGIAENEVVYTSLTVDAGGLAVGIPVEKNPDWISVRPAGRDIFQLSFNNGNESGKDRKYPIGVEAGEQLVLGIQMEDGTLTEVAIPVSYDGLSRDAIEVVREEDMEMTTVVKATGGEYKLVVTAWNDDFEVLKIGAVLGDEGAYDYNFEEELQAWIDVSVDKGNVSFKVKENPGQESREALIMIFTRKQFEQIKDNLSGNILDETGEIKTSYSNYIVYNFKQEGRKVQADRISFKADRYKPAGEEGSLSFLSDNLMSVESVDMKNDPAVSQYEVEEDNVWKLVIPYKDAASYHDDANNGGMILVVEMVGAGEGRVIEEYAPVATVRGETVSGTSYDKQTWQTINVEGWGIAFTDPNVYADDYKLVVRGEDGKVLALCIIEIAAE